MVDRGREVPVGTFYVPTTSERVVPIFVNGIMQGQFVVSENAMPPQR